MSVNEHSSATVLLLFAEMKDPVRTKVERYEFRRALGTQRFYPTLDDAVARYIEVTGRDVAAAWSAAGD